eukprot:7274461-Lingulodinium_polyedra.AAC.1
MAGRGLGLRRPPTACRRLHRHRRSRTRLGARPARCAEALPMQAQDAGYPSAGNPRLAERHG